MAFKDMIKALAGKKEPTEQEKKAEAVSALISSDNFPIIKPADIDISRYRKVPLLGIASLGAAFSQLPASARSIVQTVTTSVATDETLFVGINPKGIDGFLRANQYGTVGNIMQVNAQGKEVIAGRMRFKALENRLPVTQTTTTMVPFDPMTMVIAAALFSIDQKLSVLQEKAEEILQFLKLEKQSKQRGNLDALVEILEEYKRNSENEKFRNLRNIAVQTIKREAQQDIHFYQEQITRKLQDQKVIHGSQQAQRLLDAVMSEFYEYQLACYMYAFSSFLDVMLQQDFEAATLDAVIAKMSEHAKKYSELYIECHAQIASYQRSAIEAQLLGGLGNVAKSIGQTIAGIPVLGKGQVDEALISAGENLGRINSEAVAKKLEAFAPLEDSRMGTFIENVHSVSMMYNQSAGMITDGDNIFILEAV